MKLTSCMTTAQSKASLRKTLRQARRSIPRPAQQRAAVRLCQLVSPWLSPRRTPRIALYLAEDGELSAAPLIDYCWAHQIKVFLPVLNPLSSKMWFAHYTPESTLTPNRFGIPEPLDGDLVRLWQLNLVLLPLVGFDTDGGRLGMGGGFYDRVFANRHLWPRQPGMFGIAHECQKVDQIPREPWDIPLDGIFSDRRIYPKSG
ncbi:MAG: 5-formyltetrahydrofolate cyclo-ligase [Reinekea sp.]